MSGSKLSNASVPPLRSPIEQGDQPLGLTVHSMPVPEQAAAADAQRTSSGRWKMLLVLLICAAPVVASYLTYYVIRPDIRRSFGTLIEPQRPLPDVPTVALDGSPGNLRALQGQWLIVSVASGACDQACQTRLYLQRQLHTSLGAQRDRVDWVWLVIDDAPVAAPLREAVKGAIVARAPAAAVSAWLVPAAGQALTDHLYLVDPMGHWMMRFPARLDLEGAAKAKRDIERLLRASASWDQPGR